MKSVEAKQKVATKVAEARSIQNKYDEQGLEMPDEARQQFDSVMAEVALLKKKVADLESLEAAELEVAAQDRNVRASGAPRPSMPHHETKHEYSMLRAIRTILADKPLDGLEGEISDEIARRTKTSPKGFYMPWDLKVEHRDLTLTTGAGSIGTVTKSSLIEYLRNKMLVYTLGAQSMNDMEQAFALPKQTGGTTAYWTAEGVAPTKTNGTIGQVAFVPKTVGAYTDLTRKFIMQSAVDAETFARQDLLTTLALEIDRAAFNGSGSGAEPTGILQNSSVTTVAMGTDGAAPTWAKMIELETTVATANADLGNLRYVTNGKGRGKMKVTPRETGYPVYIWADDNTVNGYGAFATNQIPSNLTKGSGTGLSAAIFGNFADLVIAMFGGLDVLVDPYTNSNAGTVRLVALQECEIKLLQNGSFAKIVDLVTT
jgi:HK97 family phage major capsid protein